MVGIKLNQQKLFRSWTNMTTTEISMYWLPGSSPGGSRVIRRGDGIGVLGKNLFNYRYKERLEKDSVVGNISGEKEVE